MRHLLESYKIAVALILALPLGADRVTSAQGATSGLQKLQQE